MKLYRIILPVGDINAAEAFYAALLQQKGERVSPGRHYFDLEGTILACYDPKADGDDNDPRWAPHENQYIYIAVDDVEQVLARAKQLNPRRIDSRAEVMPWGERLFYMTDPWGNGVCFVQKGTEFTGLV